MSEQHQGPGSPEELARSLLASAHMDARPAPDAVRNEIIATLGAVGAVGGGLGIASALGVLRRLSLLNWVTGTAVVGLAAGGVYLAVQRAPTVGKASELSPSAMPLSLAVPAANVPADSAPVAPAVSDTPSVPELDPPAPSTQHRHAAAAGSADRVVTDTSSLEAEVAALDHARAALAAGDASRALGLLRDYDQAFPKGVLRPEATYLRIQALSKSGQDGAARSLAARFLAAHPKSPHAAQLQTLLSP